MTLVVVSVKDYTGIVRMDRQRKVYVNEKWEKFTYRVKRRDEFKCLQCGRSEQEVVLQVHHEVYIEGKAPWDYPLSDCRTLCKGCHAREHNLIEPDRGWTLISIDDLGSRDGICERQGCGNEIRYAHLTYHPKIGYRAVGSTCIEYLTQQDRLISSSVVKLYKQISKYIHETDWLGGISKNGKRYLAGKYKHHTIRIYGDENRYAFQVVLKEKGVRWHDYKDVVRVPNRNLDDVKEMAYVVLRGTIADDEKEKELLRNIYRKLKTST